MRATEEDVGTPVRKTSFVTDICLISVSLE